MLELESLPEEVVALCQAASAPPRLLAHLTLVYDVARKLVARIHAAFPDVAFDDEDVFFGAATHDIGKSIVPVELSEPGKSHESHGVALLRTLGVPERRARFAFSHGNWSHSDSIQFEDLLVAMADNCWKGKRISSLETEAVEQIAQATRRSTWEVYVSLDDILQDLEKDADARLAWQAQFPVG